MRIFGLVFGGLLLTILIVLGIWYGREKVIMGIAQYSFKNDLAELGRLRNNGASLSACLTDEDEANEIVGYQLRFVSDTEYVLETVCEVVGSNQIIKTSSLKGGVKRLYGSGVLYRVNDTLPELTNAWVHLKFDKTVVVAGYFDGVIDAKKNVDAYSIGGDSAAIASCSNWGFSCCKSGSEKGFGTSVNTSDCPKSCFQNCHQLPVALFFNTSPILDSKSRTLVLNSRKSKVDFGFEVSDFDGQVTKAVIDFGDGTVSKDLGYKTPYVSHEYSCNQTRCVYQATLSALDNDNNSLVSSNLNQIKVILEP